MYMIMSVADRTPPQPVLPTRAAVEAAAGRLAGITVVTPLLGSEQLDRLTGCRLRCKCENRQRTGSFKLRGASNALALLPPAVRGVATHSSGNHGAALAAAAARRGLEAHIVMPDNASSIKRAAVEALGGSIHDCAPTQTAREAGLAALIAAGFHPVPPYDDERIIAGQGTVALEMQVQDPQLTDLVVPVGGGGLVAGCLLAVDGREVRVTGVEPAGADDARRSLAAGRRITEHDPRTIADGLRALVGERNLAIMRAYALSILTVTDQEIRAAMDLLAEHLGERVEPSAAVTLAGVLKHPDRFAGRRVGLVLSGGNV